MAVEKGAMMNRSETSKRYYSLLRTQLSAVVEHDACDQEALAVALLALAVDIEQFRGTQSSETAFLFEQLGDHLRAQAQDIRH